MKIWVVGRNYPIKSNKMCGSFELEQAKMLAKIGNEVCYIACVFHPLYKIQKWGYCEWIDENVHIYAYSQFFFPQRFYFYLDHFKTRKWKQLLQKVEAEQGKPDIVHVHFPTMITNEEVLFYIKQKYNSIIATEHWTKVQSQKLNNHELSQLKAYVQNADAFISVSKPLCESIQKLTGTKKDLYVIPNMVSSVFDMTTMNHDGFRFIAVGRLVSVKQFDKIIHAFASAFKGNLSISLVIVGGGVQYNHLSNIIQREGVSDQIIMTGALDHKHTAEEIKKSDVLVCFSRLETFGVPVIEGWYTGLPVISSNAIGFTELWDETLGYLISYDDEEALCTSMKMIYQNYHIYDKEKIKNFAKNHFSEEIVTKQITDLYRKIIG